MAATRRPGQRRGPWLIIWQVRWVLPFADSIVGFGVPFAAACGVIAWCARETETDRLAAVAPATQPSLLLRPCRSRKLDRRDPRQVELRLAAVLIHQIQHAIVNDDRLPSLRPVLEYEPGAVFGDVLDRDQ